MKAQLKEVEQYSLPQSNFQGGDFARLLYCARIPEGVPFEAVLRPEFWTHISHMALEIGTKIEVLEDGGAYYGELIVRESKPSRVVVSKLSYVELDDLAEETENDRYIVRGSGKKWRVIDNVDKGVLQDDLQTKSQAHRWIEDHEKAQAL